MSDDLLIKLKMALGGAYSDIHAGDLRRDVVRRLSALFAEDGMREVAVRHRAYLSGLVRARTVGERCGDYVSKIQHQLLAEALADETTKEISDAA